MYVTYQITALQTNEETEKYNSSYGRIVICWIYNNLNTDTQSNLQQNATFSSDDLWYGISLCLPKLSSFKNRSTVRRHEYIHHHGYKQLYKGNTDECDKWPKKLPAFFSPYSKLMNSTAVEKKKENKTKLNL